MIDDRRDLKSIAQQLAGLSGGVVDEKPKLASDLSGLSRQLFEIERHVKEITRYTPEEQAARDYLPSWMWNERLGFDTREENVRYKIEVGRLNKEAEAAEPRG